MRIIVPLGFLLIFSSVTDPVAGFGPAAGFVVPTRKLLQKQRTTQWSPNVLTTTTTTTSSSSMHFMVMMEQSTSDFLTAMPEAEMQKDEDLYAAFGLASPDDLAIGVEIADLVKWIGTKDELTRRVQQDVKTLSTPEQVNDAVALLLLDAEVLQRVLFYEQNKEEIAALIEQQGGENTMGTIGTYATWLGVGAGLPYVKRQFIDPKFASGEWQAPHLSDFLPFLPKAEIANVVTDTLSTSSSAATAVVDAIDSVSTAAVESASNAL